MSIIAYKEMYVIPTAYRLLIGDLSSRIQKFPKKEIMGKFRLALTGESDSSSGDTLC